MKALALVITGTLMLALAMTAHAGDRAEVERVQQALQQAGHDPGSIDGVVGARTSAALRAYQKEQRLRATGQLDAATLAKLGEPVSAGGDAKPNAVDPAQANKTGANVGDGASYSRNTERGQSIIRK